MNETVQAATETSVDRVSALVLTLSDRRLLAPITAVAEVVDSVAALQREGGGPLYGWIDWREERIPLLSFEALAGAERPALDSGSRMVVLNAIHDAAESGFYALLLRALPHPLQVTPETRLRERGEDLVLMEIPDDEGAIAIPDFAALESRVREAAATR